MINFILTSVTLLILTIVTSKHNLITLIHFICLTINNIFFNQGNDMFSQTFSIAIPCICLICSIWNMYKEIYRQKLFNISLALFALCAIESFCATNALLMFIYMEASMIPMILMMYSEDKHINTNSIYQYIIYTFISACLLLVAIIQTKIDTKEYCFIPTTTWSYWFIVLSTIIKLPTFPFHYWVPVVHGKSTTTCSVLLAGVVLKYSPLIIVRFLMPLPQHAIYLILASIISAVCSQCCEKNIKVIFAYSSIIHINLYLSTIIKNTGCKDFIFSVLAHSITMTLIFFVTDIIKTRYKTLHIDKLVNISNKIWMLLLVASLCITAVPGSIGFIAELYSMYSINNYGLTIIITTILAIVLSHYYTIYTCFKLKDNVSKYDLFRYNNWQKNIIIMLIILIFAGGILVPLYIFKR